MTVMPSESSLSRVENSANRLEWLREEEKSELLRRNQAIRDAVDDGFGQDIVAKKAKLSRGQVTHVLATPEDSDGQGRIL